MQFEQVQCLLEQLAEANLFMDNSFYLSVRVTEQMATPEINALENRLRELGYHSFLVKSETGIELKITDKCQS